MFGSILKIQVRCRNGPVTKPRLIGAAQASRQRPDGYTLLLGGATTHVTEALLKTKPTYDPLKDLEPISPVTVTAFAITVHPSVPVKDLKELVAYVKANPGKMSWG